MSAIIYGRVFWTPFKELSYLDKKGKVVRIKETTAKIVMLAIADSADDFGENSWQSFETIAKKASIERRSAIRVVRALIGHGYLSIAGKTQYGTNNFTINKDILGHAPAKRAKTGRPKSGDSEALPPPTGDSDAKTGDSQAKTSDDQSPDPSLNLPQPQKNKDSMMKVISQLAFSIFTDIQIWWSVKKILERDSVWISGEGAPDLDNPMQITIGGLNDHPKGGQFSLAEIWEDRFTRSFLNNGIQVTFQE